MLNPVTVVVQIAPKELQPAKRALIAKPILRKLPPVPLLPAVQLKKLKLNAKAIVKRLVPARRESVLPVSAAAANLHG